MLNSSEPILKPYRRSTRHDTTAQELVVAILGDRGIYAKLEKRWDAYKAHAVWHSQAFIDPSSKRQPTFVNEQGQTRPGSEALSPSPLVDKELSELVEICIRAYKEGTVAEFFDIANADPIMRRRLAELPPLTEAAEGEMEKHYARLALDRITVRDEGNGHIALSEQAVDGIKENAEARLEKYLVRTGIAFHWQEHDGMRQIMADNAADKETVAQTRRILRLDETIKPFPYTHNYEHIAYGEKRLLNDPRSHQNFPESMLKEHQESMLEGRSPEEATAIIDKNPEIFGIPHLEDKYLTFVGSGALPLTGLMNQIISGCKINLVDLDPEAVEISRKFVTYLELLGVLEKDAVKVYAADGSEVHYGGPRKSFDRQDYAGEVRRNMPHVEPRANAPLHKTTKDKLYIPTDVIYIAGLIPNPVKHAILLNLEANKQDPVRSIMVRSARGLSGMLYEPIQSGPFNNNPHYHTHGTLVPERHVLPYNEPLQALKEDAATPASVSAILSDDNVNTAILLHRSDLPLLDSHIAFTPDSEFARHVERDLGHKADYSHIDRLEAQVLLDAQRKASPPTL